MNLKTRFRTLLSPYLEMLRHKQKELSNKEWLDQVERTRTSVILNADQYLGIDLPHFEIVEVEVSAVFAEFINESLLRADATNVD